MEDEQRDDAWVQRFHVLAAGEQPPAVLADLAGRDAPQLVWRNELGGQTWRLDERYLKWTPDGGGIDLDREVERLRRLRGRLPVPQVLDSGHDGRGSWFLSGALPGTSAVSAQWRAQPQVAVHAIAEGLRRLHATDGLDLPSTWDSWATRRPPALGRPPAVEQPVIVHGDACAPNTLIAPDGGFLAVVDVGDLVLGDRWADLAVASMSLDWNFGPGWQQDFFDAYGIEPDHERIDYFRRLWHRES